ncbi:MAG: cytochrome C [Chrysiogenetes bacterium]|nr:cytochrome C [Chrysiogenetes bacterium]
MSTHADKEKQQRLIVLGLVCLAIGIYVASFFLPYWNFTLLAPQYPQGLRIQIGLDHLEGDVGEVSGLNHYIGMRSLDEAAVLERAIAPYAVGVLCVSLLVFVLVPSRKYSWLALAPGLVFPLAFIGDSFYWLYQFGNHLDPRAPITIAPFTPTLLGKGAVGQFETIATPAAGFYLALLGFVVITVAWYIKRRICWGCRLRHECHFVCPNMTVGSGGTSATSGAEEGDRVKA